MANGTVKWFNSNKGFGFIEHEAGGQDVFVRASTFECAGIDRLDEGQQVTFEVETCEDGRESASGLELA